MDIENSQESRLIEFEKMVLAQVKKDIIDDDSVKTSEKMEVLGENQNVEIFKGFYYKLEIDCVVKCLKNDDKYQFELFLNEMFVLSKIKSHPNIVNLIGFVVSPSLKIITKYIDGKTLETTILGKMHIDLNTLVLHSKYISFGMAHLHELGIIHGDLSVNNVMLDSKTGTLKIIDFGLSEFESEKRYTKRKLPIRICSPETISSNSISKENDIWSFGIILWELMSWQIAFKDMFPLEIAGIYAKNEEKII